MNTSRWGVGLSLLTKQTFCFTALEGIICQKKATRQFNTGLVLEFLEFNKEWTVNQVNQEKTARSLVTACPIWRLACDMIVEQSDANLRYVVYFPLFRSSMGTRTAPPPYRTCCAHPSWLATSACCRWAGTPASPCGWTCWCAWTSVPEVHLARLFPHFPSFPCQPAACQTGDIWSNTERSIMSVFFGNAGGKLSRAGGHFRCTIYWS